MRIREYMPGDLEALRRLHAAQGFGYPLPDLDSPLFLTKLVLEDDGEDGVRALLGARQNIDSGRELADRNSPLDFQSCGGKTAQAEACATGGTGFSLCSVPNSRKTNSAQTGVCEAGSSRVTMAVLLRLTAEAYLLHDAAAGTPRRRYQQFLALHDAARTAALARGLDDVQAFLPPRIARAFGRRLARLGWMRDPWPCFSRRV